MKTEKVIKKMKIRKILEPRVVSIENYIKHQKFYYTQLVVT